MKIKLFCSALIAAALTASSASALLKIQTFDTAPENVEDDFSGSGGGLPGLSPGNWGTREEENRTTSHRDDMTSHNVFSTWNSGGWIQPVGTETIFNNRGPIDAINYEHIPTSAVLTNFATGVVVYDNDSWGDVSTATFLTMDVKGSFAGTGGLTVVVNGEEGESLWSWTANVSDVSVGANPGDVTEWTNILIPINKPTIQFTGHVFPSVDGTEGHIDGDTGAGVTHTTDGIAGGGNWGVNSEFADDAEMIAAWDSAISSVVSIAIRGLTPDTQVDNLGFILPDGTPGDFDSDNDIDGADFLAWQRGESPSSLSASDLADWETNFGTVAPITSIAAVPEPSTLTFVLLASFGLLGARRNR